MFANIPEVKLGIIAVSRGCFPMALSERRRAAIKAAYGEGLYECPVTVENELDARRAVEDVQAAGVNALVVFLGNFGPETPETLIAEWFSGPIMYAAAAEGDGDLHDGRGDAYCGMLNCSYNLGLRGKTAYIPEYPVGTAPELAEKVAEFVPIARAILGLRGLPSARVPMIFWRATGRSKRCTTWAWRWKKTASWIYWSPTTSMRTTRAFRPKWPRCRRSWAETTSMRVFCPVWPSTS